MLKHIPGSREMCLFQSSGLLPSMDMLMPLLLKTMIMRDGDIEHTSGHTAKITAAAVDRFKKAGWENFDKFVCLFPLPSALCAYVRVLIFLHVQLRCPAPVGGYFIEVPVAVQFAARQQRSRRVLPHL